MPVALEQFVKQIADSGVIAPGKLENFMPPKAFPKDAQELAKQLVQSKQLTKYQVQEIYSGRAKSLILGNYTILDRIGAGGMGQVFKAEHRRMKRIVAIKMLPRTVTKDPAAIARFQREVEAAAKLEHPNIVTAHDADEADGVHFLVMQCVEGSDLSALVKKNGPFSIAKAVNYTLQAARGLDYAHKHGVVHRDVKPANLLLNSEGTVKILDMGLARIEGDKETGTQAELTGTGAVLGTVDYMAPEQALSTKHADARADIYSLGCSLHYLITGHAAYDGDTLMAKLLAHREKPIPSLGAQAPPELQAVFEKMVAKKIGDRYQTMSEAVAALERCSDGQQTSLSLQPSAASSSGSDVMTFLRNAALNTVRKPRAKTKGLGPLGNARPKLIFGGIAGMLGLAIVAFIIVRMRSNEGTPDSAKGEATVAAADGADRSVTKWWLAKKREPGAHGFLIVESDGEATPINSEQDLPKGDFRITRLGASMATDADLSNLARLPNVRELQLTDSAVTDAGVERLSGATNLARIVLNHTNVTAAGIAALRKALPNCKVDWDGNATPIAKWDDPAFQEWRKGIATLPAEQQVDAVARKLQELNPGFDSKLKDWSRVGPAIENGVVTKFGFATDSVTDISPVSALRGLQLLECVGSQSGAGKLADLSPLQGLQLTKLDCFNNPAITTLAPLNGMPLAEVGCFATRVSDLSPLRGMQLTGINLIGTQVSDLSPLRGMPLTKVFCSFTHVSDVSPLANNSTLQTLDLRHLKITPASVETLKTLEHLQKLDVGGTNVMVRDIAALQKALPKCQITWDDPAKSDRDWNSPAFQQWMKTVATMPADKQVEAVAKKLQEFNPGFDGMLMGEDLKHGPTIENGVVTELRFWTDNTADISPVRALLGLRLLDCRGSYKNRRWGTLSDLSPLQGMHLTTLICGTNPIVDLSPLQGMPLKILRCDSTSIADLAPLRGMALVELQCARTGVQDLSPIRGLQISYLNFDHTKVSSLDALVGMPLTMLICNDTPVSDLSPLAGMRLTTFIFTPRTAVKGIEEIRRMQTLDTIGVSWDVEDRFAAAQFWKKYDAGEFSKPDSATFQQWLQQVSFMPAEKQVESVAKKLQELNPGFDGTVVPKIEGGVVKELQFVSDDITDISPVRALTNLTTLSCSDSGGYKGKLSDLSSLAGMKLQRLFCGGTKVSNLSPLRGMPLTELHCNGTQVESLSPLQGMQLKALNCGTTHVSDLSPLRGMPLTDLSTYNTQVSDLSPLKGMHLRRFACHHSQVSDLSPLEGMQLTHVTFTPQKINKGMDVLRRMTSIVRIGANEAELPPAEFWKKYDAGEFNK